ncbi:hypothetical protein ACJ73_08438 [Blastomyces percursus]|uniref:Uncharacterized protein n=1 Tax=Blastomyces percursus TaxID=1658174 RepID=A0A1J9PVA7_9EURO|nr:hypothetical protein ACJ73_08438 [Blastomyces percursus]
MEKPSEAHLLCGKLEFERARTRSPDKLEIAFFQLEGALIEQYFDIMEDTESMFFRKMSLADFNASEFEYPISPRIEEEEDKGPWEHYATVESDISKLTHTATLFEYGGWHEERCVFDGP